MSKRLFMVVLAALTLGLQAFAQNSVTGKVTDSKGEAMIGANVLVKGTHTGTVTDVDGFYSLSGVNANSVLVFSSIGYAEKEVTVGNKKVINVVLEDDSEYLNEIVIIGYGAAKRKDLTGALTQIDNSLISQQNTSSASKALEGAVPGIVYSSVDGQPGNDAGIRVRGLGSTQTGNSDALIIIDGVPAQGSNPLSNLNSEDIASMTVLKDAASTAIYGSRGANGVILVTTKSGASGKTKVSFQARAGLNTVGAYENGMMDNAADIYEYMWKSIYNSYRYGINGGPVLDPATGEYITHAGAPNVSDAEAAAFASQHLFNFKGYNTDGTIAYGRNNLNNFMAYKVPGAQYLPDGTAATSSATMKGAYLVGLDGKINPDAVLLYNDSYADALLKTGFRQQYDVAASGGSDKEDHYISVGYLTDPSYIPNSNFDRFTGRAKINAQLFDWLKVGTNISFTRSKTNYQGTYWQARNSGSNQGNIVRFVKGQTALIPVYAHDADGNFIYDANGEKVRNYNENSTYSPLGQTGSNYGPTDIIYAMNNDVRQDLTSNLNTRSYAEIPFLKHFIYRFDFAYDKIDNIATRYNNGTTGRAKGVGGYFSKTVTDTQVYNLQNRVSYVQDFGKHHVDAMALQEYSDWESEYARYGSGDEFIPGFIASGNFVTKSTGAVGTSGNNGYGHDIERMMSYLGRANYIYNNKYYLSGSIRRDGSSKFRADKRWGTFWSVGGGWRITEEPWMEDIKGEWLTNAKVRSSYGVIGNQNGIGRYQTYRTWSYSTSYQSTTNGTGTSDGGYKLTMGGLVNTDLTWEETNTFDLGIDMTIAKRVDITLDFYNRVTGNSQFAQPVSYLAMGQTSLPRNCAEITNRGIELDINADIIRTKDWRWNVAFNASHYNTVLTALPEDCIPAHVEGLPDGTWFTADGAAWSAAGGAGQSAGFYLRGVGRDWYNLYMFRYAGVDQSTGLPLYWHRVSEDDHTAGKYTDKEVGSDVTTNNYVNASRYEVGDALPELQGGFNTSLTWKNFTISAQFAYQIGGKFFSREYCEYLWNGTGCTSSMMFVSKDMKNNTWTPDNTSAKFPMQWYATGENTYFTGTSTNGGNWNFTDMALFDASYLRVKNITMSYNMPKSLLEKTTKGIVSSARVFASADNLWIFSAAKGLDPSMSVSGGMCDVDSYTFPAMRTFTLGVNVDF